MQLPEWCQTHSLKDFFNLVQDKKEDNMTVTNEQMTEAHTISTLNTPEVDSFIAAMTKQDADHIVDAIGGDITKDFTATEIVQTEEDIGGTPL